MRTATARMAGVLMGAALLLAACTGTDNTEPPDNTDPPGNASPDSPSNDAQEPDPQTLDDDEAADLYVAWREAVYALPAIDPEAVDTEAAGDGIVVTGSEAADWIAQELQLARDRGVITRGSVHAEAISPVQIADDRATVTICSSADVRITDLATGDTVSDEAIDNSYTRFAASFQQAGDSWLVETADRSDERACVPPSVEGTVTAQWETFTEAWYERDRQGGGEDLGRLTEVVTDDFGSTLRGLPARDPVPDPDPFTDFELVAATPTTATGHACRSGGLQTVEWMLVDGQWQVDFAGREGEESPPCP